MIQTDRLVVLNAFQHHLQVTSLEALEGCCCGCDPFGRQKLPAALHQPADQRRLTTAFSLRESQDLQMADTVRDRENVHVSERELMTKSEAVKGP